jgi:hypothetical protein
MSLRFKDHDSKVDASSDLLPSARRAEIESGADGLRLRQRCPQEGLAPQQARFSAPETAVQGGI